MTAAASLKQVQLTVGPQVCPGAASFTLRLPTGAAIAFSRDPRNLKVRAAALVSPELVNQLELDGYMVAEAEEEEPRKSSAAPSISKQSTPRSSGKKGAE